MRNAVVERKTKETQIYVELNLDEGNVDINTGIGFFNHMLTAFAVHGGFGLTVKVKGDLEVDCHHTIEDTGIVLGKAFYKALGDKSGIERYGSFYIPMDEALAFASVDISGRPFLVFNAEFPQAVVGEYDACMTEEFFRAFSFNSGLTLHIKSEYGANSHHIIEAIFKAVAHALKCAVSKNENGETLSTKGSLD
ncbi:MAG: imidazoleglycerol-phosphate dehydratase HisB [Acutalibacteraceae bacterium]|nr:imidazoleglycerol-phosphate dehydratase HisB [Acutalibacteraceae bacterium]